MYRGLFLLRTAGPLCHRELGTLLDSVTGLKNKLFFYSIVSSLEIRPIWWFDVTKVNEVLTLSQSEVIS